ncbi:MAG: hypothetical protein HQL32_02625 [Planctomycetes bacterium]|nr:hypothetical protein [Planctomycetota bacterium]
MYANDTSSKIFKLSEIGRKAKSSESKEMREFLSSLSFMKGTTKIPSPKLRHSLFALIDMDCYSCNELVKSLILLRKKADTPPIYLITIGDKESLDIYFEELGTSFVTALAKPIPFYTIVREDPPMALYWSPKQELRISDGGEFPSPEGVNKK